MPDSFSATWVSYSSISDFLRCPRAYQLKNVLKHPVTNKKVTLMSPPLALGQTVHGVVESLAQIEVHKRFVTPLTELFDEQWKRVSGTSGGFSSMQQEDRYKERGRAMLDRITKHPGPINEKAIRLKTDLPKFWLSEQDNIILCGKIDWLQYFEKTDSVKIIDFKTSKTEEDGDSLQLPIYLLLTHYCQKRAISGIAYWYLELHDAPQDQKLPDLQISQEKILKIAKQIKTARALERFKCPEGEKGCRWCSPYEAIFRGDAELIGSDGRREIYILKSGLDGIPSGAEDREDGEIL
jgi:ATP-dependent helicase/DNAse subunit B